MKAIERLYQYMEYKGLKPTALEKEIGLSNGYLGVQRKRNADMLTAKYPAPVSSASDAPNADALELPSTSWLAIGLLNTCCKSSPDSARDEPIMKDRITRGSRMLNTTVSAWSLQVCGISITLEIRIFTSSIGPMG